MALGLVPGKKKGQHYELAMFALNKAKKVNLLLKGQTEKHFEFTIVSHLQSSPRLRKNLITQIGVDEVEKMTKASLFGFSHWPDVSIGNSGTAIEIKVVQGGPWDARHSWAGDCLSDALPIRDFGGDRPDARMQDR